jgi:hypothetical protein
MPEARQAPGTSIAIVAWREAMDPRSRRGAAEPDGEEGGREVIACDHALPRAVPIHLEAGTRRVDEGQPLAALHIRHPALEPLDTLVQSRELLLGVVHKALLPGLLEIVVADVMHEVEDQLLGGVRREKSVRIAGDVRHVEGGDIDIDL